MASSSAPLPVDSVLALIGNTPMVRVRHMDTGCCSLYIKLENQNPGGSIKDRMALAMVVAAEESGQLRPGGTIVEATAGNTGLALALIAAQRGYKLKLVIPDKMSQEKIFHLKALGVEVISTRSDVGKGHPEYYQDMAATLALQTGAFYSNQFENPANPLAHQRFTAPEIWQQMEQQLDAVVCGVGTGGTLTGLGRFFASVAPQVAMVLADPKGSVLAPYIHTGQLREAGSWLVEGIGEDFIPTNCDLSFVKHAYTISDEESITTARQVLEAEGILCGSSSGTLIAAALRFCREQQQPKRVVTFACDSGNKYLSKIFNPYWLEDQGLIDTPAQHDLRDLIKRPAWRGQTITAAPEDTLQRVYAKMKLHDVSQVPVLSGGKLVGLLDETDLLMAVAGNPAGFAIHVGQAMTKNIITLDVKSPVTALQDIFSRGLIGCVVEGSQFLGIITPLDLLHYLRKRTAMA